jgi:hypothetical protein
MASVLKKRMQDKRFFYPLLSWEKPYRGDVCNEFNVERFALRKDGGLVIPRAHMMMSFGLQL